MVLERIGEFFKRLIRVSEQAAPLDRPTRSRLMHLFYLYDSLDSLPIYESIRDERIRISAHTREKKSEAYVVEMMREAVESVLRRDGFDALLATLSATTHRRKSEEEL